MTFIHPTAVVEEGAQIGEGTRIWHFAHVRKGAKIGRNCNLGKGVYVDAGVEIGDNVKIQNFVSVYRGVTVEDDAFLGPSATLTNDLLPRSTSEEWEIVPTKIRRGASIGANATILCGVEIGENALVGAGSVVTRDVPPHGLVYGVPARLRGFVCYCGSPLSHVEKIEKEKIIYKCEKCGKHVSVPFKDYARMIAERATRI